MRHGCHVCAIVERNDEIGAVVKLLIGKATTGGYTWVFVHDGFVADKPLRLPATGLPDGKMIDAAALGLLTTPFAVPTVIDKIQGLAAEAKERGFSGILVLVQMSCLLQTASGMAHHGDLEAALENLAADPTIRIVCIYNRNLFPGPAMLDALRTHRQICTGQRFLANPHYLPPAIFLRGDAQAQLSSWLAAMSGSAEDDSGRARPWSGGKSRSIALRRRHAGPRIGPTPPERPKPEPEVSKRWKIRCFGELRVYRSDGSAVAWDAAGGATLKTKTLFAFLLNRGATGATVEEIADLLWPDAESTAQSLNRLYHTVHCLRLALDPDLPANRKSDLLVCRNRRYVLTLPEGTWIDVPLFEQLCRQGEKLIRSGQQAEALACHLAADTLYTGQLLADIPVEYAENLDRDWCWSRRYWLEEIHVKMLTYTARLFRQAGDADRAVAYGERALVTDSCFEPAYAELLRSFHALGRRDAFERQYQLYCNALRRFDQRGPSPDIRTLHDSLAARFGPVGVQVHGPAS